MKIAIIGCGEMANIHAQIVREMGYEIHLCISKSVKSKEEFQRRWNVKYSSCDFYSIFSEKIDVVHICTPPALHYEMAKECLVNNIHVICEKPLCLYDEEASELFRLAYEKKLVNATGFNIRFHHAIDKIKNSIKDIGHIYLVHGSYTQEFHALPSPYSWRYKEELAGRMRAVTEIGSHFFDLTYYLTGQSIRSVSARFKNANPDRYLNENGIMYLNPSEESNKISINSEDIAIVNFELENGALGCVVLSEVSHGRINRLSMEITGEKASFFWNSEENNIIHRAEKGKGINTEVLAFSGGFIDSLRGLYREVYNHIENKDYPVKYPTFKDGAMVTKVCNAVYKSALNNGAYVEVSYDNCR